MTTDPEPDFKHNPHAEAARTLKAAALETQLSASRIPSDAVRRWDGTGWEVTLPAATRRGLEKAAGTRRASEETWLRAAALLADYENTRRGL